MPLIRTAINKRNYVVGPGPGETIAVFTRTGYRYLSFKGFVDHELAAHVSGAIPVKLYAKAFSSGEDGFSGWIDLKPNEALQGCVFNGSVWSVLQDGVPRKVPRACSELR